MRIAQHKIKWLTRLMLVAALFTQGVLVAHACVAPAVRTVQMMSNAGAMLCHEPENSNVYACLMHCSQPDQVNLDQQTVAAISVNENMLRVAMKPVPQDVLIAARTLVPLNCGPPLAIRFCSFLI